MEATVKHFKDQVSKGQYKAAAQIYFNRAYQYQKEFNEILDNFDLDPYYEGVKDVVMLELENLDGYGDYVDQI